MKADPGSAQDGRRCLFLAPMKPPDHPTPSGDRLIARQFLRLLDRLGFEAEIPSVLRTWCARPDDLSDIANRAAHELESAFRREETRPASERPAFVFTYHNYYKAPDLIGPSLARELGIPYVLAESSRAPHRASGPWAAGHHLAEIASDAAALILTPTSRDERMLESLRPGHQRIVRLVPFTDLAEWPGTGVPEYRVPGHRETRGPARLLSVAMMRPGVKVLSYQRIAAALHRLPGSDWTLDIVGDGEGRGEVETMFAPFGDRIRFHGAFDDKARLGALYRQADAFVWPGVGEAIGMVYLEAQAHGLPCLAYRYGGVADVVSDGVTGFVVSPDDEALFAHKLTLLIGDSKRRRQLGAAACRHVQRFHTLEAATRSLAVALETIGLTVLRSASGISAA